MLSVAQNAQVPDESSEMPTTPHPFARFIAILVRGRNLSRALTLEEAE